MNASHTHTFIATYSTHEVFYDEIMVGSHREDRLWELAKKEGMSKSKFDRLLEDGKVSPDKLSHLLMKQIPSLPLATWQVPVTFSFLDVHAKKGLNEDMESLTCFLSLIV